MQRWITRLAFAGMWSGLTTPRLAAWGDRTPVGVAPCLPAQQVRQCETPEPIGRAVQEAPSLDPEVIAALIGRSRFRVMVQYRVMVSWRLRMHATNFGPGGPLQWVERRQACAWPEVDEPPRGVRILPRWLACALGCVRNGMSVVGLAITRAAGPGPAENARSSKIAVFVEDCASGLRFAQDRPGKFPRGLDEVGIVEKGQGLLWGIGERSDWQCTPRVRGRRSWPASGGGRSAANASRVPRRYWRPSRSVGM